MLQIANFGRHRRLSRSKRFCQRPCPTCVPTAGAKLTQTQIVTQQPTELPRQPLIRPFHIYVGQCQGCGQRVQGRHPLQTSDALGAAASQLGPDAQAAMTVLNKQAGLAHGKVAACRQDLFGIEVTRGARAQVNLRAAERLQPACQEIVEAIREAPQLTVDETGWCVGGLSAWLHVWVGIQATCYVIDPHRSADGLERTLGWDGDGVLLHEGFASYDRCTAATHQQCVAHVLRRAQELLATATGGAVRFPQQLLGLFRAGVHLRNAYWRGHVPLADLAAGRGVLEDPLAALRVRERAVPAYQTLTGHLVRHFDEWFNLLTDPMIEATNWQAEQAVRPAELNRKVWGGNRTEAGAQAQGVLSSVLQTCRQQARSALDFVSQTLRSFGNHLLLRPVLLVPANQ